MKPTVINLLNVGERYLKRAGVLTHRLSSERLLEHIMRDELEDLHQESWLSYGVAGLYLDRLRVVGRAQRRKFFKFLKERARRYPLQYLLGEAHFMDFAFKVDERCLIPRPETELLVEETLAELKTIIPSGEVRILDIGTGCGNIGLSLASYLPFSEVCAVDVSVRVLALAEENAAELGVRNRVEVIQGNLFENVPDGRFTCVVSNPPYLSSEDMAELEGELSFEPKEALFGGVRGTEFIRSLAEGARKCLMPGGFLCFEMGMGQVNRVRKELENLGYIRIRTIADYAGIERVALAHFGELTAWTK